MRLSSGMIALGAMILGLIAYKNYNNTNYAWFGITTGLAIWSFNTYISELKYKSPIVVSGTVHGSFDRAFLVDDYVIIPLGAVKAEGFYIEGGSGFGGEGFIIAPSDAFMWLGSNAAVVLADPIESDPDEIPPTVYDFIERRWGIKPTTVVYYTDTFYPIQALEDIDVQTFIKNSQARLEERLRYWHKQIEILKRLLSGRHDIILEFVDTLGYVDSRLRKTSQGSVIKEMLSKPPTEEE